LALDLFALYLKITDPRSADRTQHVQAKAVGLRGKARFTATKTVLRIALSPPLFTVAMQSYAEVNDFHLYTDRTLNGVGDTMYDRRGTWTGCWLY
jgi:hypothetical protein